MTQEHSSGSPKPARLAPVTEAKREAFRARVLAAWIGTTLAAMLLLTACSPNKPEETQAAPSAGSTIDGANLLETRCSTCHSVDRAKAAKKTRDEWDQTVTRMIGKGAQLNDAEKTALVDYLAKTYGP